ncbi:MAG: hypothetical protein KKB25_02050 [Nanoarchaeota archaeon]|nr:hypothetical protein [Nanoarchaeota archaeon]
MTELITYDTIRKAHRAEKQEIALQKFPDSFFLLVRGWIDHKQSAQKSLDSLSDIKNAKGLLDDLLNRREKKLVIAALHTIRGDLPPQNMTLDEEKLFDNLVNILKQARQDMREQMFGCDGIIEEKLDSARAMMDEMKTSGGGESAVAQEKADNGKNETGSDCVAGGAGGKTGAAPEISGITKLKIIADMPSFVDAEMKAYGPFKAGTVAELPREMAQILLARKVAEAV